jgi:drug/metabolite transporter (DMT)-like permease
MRLKADITLLVVAIIWGTAFVAQRIAGQMGSAYLFNAARYLLAALVVLPLAIRVGRASSPTGQVANLTYLPRAQYKWMLIAGSLLFLGSVFQQVGVVYTTAGNAGFITGLYVVLVPFALFVFWREKPHWLSIVAVILAGIGAFLLSTGGKPEVRAGDLLVLISTLFWTFHVILLGKYASRFEAISFSVGQLFICGVLNFGLGVFIESFPPFAWSWLGAVVYTAFFSLGLAYTLQIWAQRHTPPADAALVMSLEAIFAVLAGWLFLGEKLATIQVFGCVLIFIAVLLSQFKEWTSGALDHDHLVEGR